MGLHRGGANGREVEGMGAGAVMAGANVRASISVPFSISVSEAWMFQEREWKSRGVVGFVGDSVAGERGGQKFSRRCVL